VSTGPNAEQIEYWNACAGPRWIAADLHLARMLAPLDGPLMERAAALPGERVLDVGCGTGQSAARLAARVGSDGAVLGVDVSAPMLARARMRASELSLVHLDFTEADAQLHGFDPGSFDLVFSRFGVMFFAQPTAAFANLAAATRAGGRLTFACWRGFAENAWVSASLAAMSRHIEVPPPPAAGAPGPFAFADADRVRALLTAAGWRDVALEPVDARLPIGTDVDDAVRFATEVGPTATPLREAEPAARDAALADMREAYGAALGDDGVGYPGAIWLVTAAR